jgi:hypothetical protein
VDGKIILPSKFLTRFLTDSTLVSLVNFGFIAHEVQELFPFLVTGEKDGEIIQSINYNGFIPLVVKEIQSLKKINDEIIAKIEMLTHKLDNTNI